MKRGEAGGAGVDPFWVLLFSQWQKQQYYAWEGAQWEAVGEERRGKQLQSKSASTGAGNLQATGSLAHLFLYSLWAKAGFYIFKVNCESHY